MPSEAFWEMNYIVIVVGLRRYCHHPHYHRSGDILNLWTSLEADHRFRYYRRILGHRIDALHLFGNDKCKK